tara:strand:+ start:77 stop:337 length:261 start_codon:yes stop_codon:yes gene_type:complete
LDFQDNLGLQGVKMVEENLSELLADFDQRVNDFSDGYRISYFDNDVWGNEGIFINEFRIRALDIALIAQKLEKFSNEEISEAIEDD